MAAGMGQLRCWMRFARKTGGFVRCHFTPSREIEAKIKEETKATLRCIPFEYNGPQATAGKDIYTGEETRTQVLFAQAY